VSTFLGFRERFARRLWRRRTAYRAVFAEDNHGLPLVLADLERFCHARATTAVAGRDGALDPLAAAQLEGRRQVWLRIRAMCELSDEQINALTSSAPQDSEGFDE
jgi:hypothetical protein